MSQTERLYWIDDQIQAERYPNAEGVAAHFEVSRRTAFADVKYLRERLEAPVQYSHARSGWYYTEPRFRLPPLGLSDREAETLRRALLAARAYLPPPDTALVSHLAAKLSSFLRHLPVEGLEGGEIMGGQMEMSPGLLLSEAMLEDLRRAVERRHRVRLVYFSAHRGERTERTVRPYTFLNWRGEVYLVAYCEWRNALRDFFLPRIREYAVLDPAGAFAPDTGFDRDAYLRDAFALQRGEEAVCVRVRFSPYQARWIRERRYHPSQENEETPDGGLILTLRVSGLAEIKRWILGFGAHAEALEPQLLRDELAAELAKMSPSYASVR